MQIRVHSNLQSCPDTVIMESGAGSHNAEAWKCQCQSELRLKASKHTPNDCRGN